MFEAWATVGTESSVQGQGLQAQGSEGTVRTCEAGDLKGMEELPLWSEPVYVWQSSLQCPLQGWGHGKVIYGAGQRPGEACHEQSLVCFCYDKGFQLLGEAQPRTGFSWPGVQQTLLPQILGSLAFNSGCDFCFTKWATEMTLIPVQILHNKCMPWNGCSLHPMALLLSMWKPHSHTSMHAVIRFGVESIQ